MQAIVAEMRAEHERWQRESIEREQAERERWRRESRQEWWIVGCLFAGVVVAFVTGAALMSLWYWSTGQLP